MTTAYIGNHTEWDLATSSLTRYYYAGSTRVAMRKNNTVYYLLSDHLGSTSLTTDENGQNPVKQLYLPWGEVRYSSGGLQTKYSYTGQYSNVSDFGLMYYNARWYDSLLGRFTSADTIVPQPGKPLDWDRYGYTKNNPNRYTDITGHFSEDEIQQYFGVDSWDEVLRIFQEGGALSGRWGWLTVMQKAELGDEISIYWDADQLPNDHPGVKPSYTGKFELDKSGQLIITGENWYMDQMKAAKYGSNYSLMHYTNDDAKKGAAAFLIAATDLAVGLPAFFLIISGQPGLMIAGEALETLVVTPVNILGYKMWRDAEHGKLEEVLNVSAIPNQYTPYRPSLNQETR